MDLCDEWSFRLALVGLFVIFVFLVIFTHLSMLFSNLVLLFCQRLHVTPCRFTWVRVCFVFLCCLFFFFFSFPSYISGVHHFLSEIFAYVTVF